MTEQKGIQWQDALLLALLRFPLVMEPLYHDTLIAGCCHEGDSRRRHPDSEAKYQGSSKSRGLCPISWGTLPVATTPDTQGGHT